MRRRNLLIASGAAAVCLAALAFLAPLKERSDRLTVVDWKVTLSAGKSESHPFAVYADDHAWMEIQVEAPETGEGVDIRVTHEGSPVEGLSASRILGKKTLWAVVPGDIYDLSLANPGSIPTTVHVAVVRDYGK